MASGWPGGGWVLLRNDKNSRNFSASLLSVIVWMKFPQKEFTYKDVREKFVRKKRQDDWLLGNGDICLFQRNYLILLLSRNPFPSCRRVLVDETEKNRIFFLNLLFFFTLIALMDDNFISRKEKKRKEINNPKLHRIVKREKEEALINRIIFFLKFSFNVETTKIIKKKIERFAPENSVGL